jgi:thymidylate kinase
MALVIFEGVDGAGKTTVARRYAKATDSHYVAFKEYPQLGTGYNRMYLEAMLPAIMGLTDIVFDRSWLSEWPYADAYRNGQRRLTTNAQRVLERAALACGACVVICNPGPEAIEASYRRRRDSEMLKSIDQVRQVYSAYSRLSTALPVVHYDYTAYPEAEGDIHLRSSILKASSPTMTFRGTATGSMLAVLIVAAAYRHPVAECNLYTPLPFSDFNEAGQLSRVAALLEESHVGEHKTMWVDTLDDNAATIFGNYPKSYVLALDEYSTRKALQSYPSERVISLHNVFSATEYRAARRALGKISIKSFGDLYGK